MDRTTRTAALWATIVAVPVAVIVALVAISALPDAEPEAAPSSGAPRPVPTTPVEMAAPTLGTDETVACRALTSQLPVTLRDLPQRPVSAGPEQNVAYGEPAITVACGGDQPSFLATDLVYPLSGVCWHATETASGSTWTTVDRRVPVTVTIPKDYESPGQWTTEFSATIASTLLSREDVPTGCRS
ncbi:DUF3515 family protein [Catenuloplanes atrovinosus]|uniref:DUF3515 domain-containing protein n=1 Tax=Catenuloplanes atrovinosus TaxID=137266 RepID=A0AAE4C689_9ACTN|nr:DUF3515 family protein [Catenuloplanes atrovinosus]MDR7273281.1 hypothetical protein [Catenuloplanes atrovinosus]